MQGPNETMGKEGRKEGCFFLLLLWQPHSCLSLLFFSTRAQALHARPHTSTTHTHKRTRNHLTFANVASTPLFPSRLTFTACTHTNAIYTCLCRRKKRSMRSGKKRDGARQGAEISQSGRHWYVSGAYLNVPHKHSWQSFKKISKVASGVQLHVNTICTVIAMGWPITSSEGPDGHRDCWWSGQLLLWTAPKCRHSTAKTFSKDKPPTW